MTNDVDICLRLQREVLVLRGRLAKEQAKKAGGTVLLALSAVALAWALWRWTDQTAVERRLHSAREYIYYTTCPHGESIQVTVPLGAPVVKGARERGEE